MSRPARVDRSRRRVMVLRHCGAARVFGAFPGLASEGPASSALGEPDDVANIVLLLASDESKFVNGISIRVDIAESVMEGVVL